MEARCRWTMRFGRFEPVMKYLYRAELSIALAIIVMGCSEWWRWHTAWYGMKIR
jgi:hypothetical protein